MSQVTILRLFPSDPSEPLTGGVRHDDPITSHLTANDPANAGRWSSHRCKLLRAFAALGSLSYEQAGQRVGLDNVRATRRCSELLKDGLIAFDGTYGVTSTESTCRKFVITADGRRSLAALKAKAS